MNIDQAELRDNPCQGLQFKEKKKYDFGKEEE
jgi:hypothetical protein